MGRRGPAPTPTERLKLAGSWRANHRTGEPKPTVGRPRCPAWLDKAAKAKWRALVPELERLGLLTVIDGDALAAYCQAWAELEIATRTLQAEGRTFGTESGYLAPHPAVAQQRSAWNAVKSFAALFGLDPSSRSRISAPPDAAAEVDELEKFIKDGTRDSGPT
jgi:P27 family predicted phage terminase small subunit